MRRAPLALVFLFASFAGLFAADSTRTVSLVLDSAAGKPAQHGAAKFEAALRAQGWSVERAASPETAAGVFVVTARLEKGGATESLGVKRPSARGRPALQLSGADDRGLMYALLDVA